MLFRQGEDVECVSTFRKVDLRTELHGKASQDALVRSWDGDKLAAASLIGDRVSVCGGPESRLPEDVSRLDVERPVVPVGIACKNEVSSRRER